MDRRTLLTSSLGTLGAFALGGCASDETTGDVMAGASNTGGAPPDPTGGAGTGTPSATGSANGGVPGMNPSSTSTSPTGMGGANNGGAGNTAGTGMGGSGGGAGADAGGAGPGGSGGNAGAGMGGSGGNAGASMGGSGGSAGDSMGGSSGGASGGAADMDGGAAGGGVCVTEVEMVNGHTHEVTVPWGDVELGFQEAPYTLEDGGTGHTHTLEVTAYDFLYLTAGVVREVTSSMDGEHTHICAITCTAA